MFTNPCELHHLVLGGCSQTDRERSSTGRSIQIQALSSNSLEPADLDTSREKYAKYLPSSTTLCPPHLLFLPLSLFLKAWLHHPQCPHFNNASQISHWLQDLEGGRGGGESKTEKCTIQNNITRTGTTGHLLNYRSLKHLEHVARMFCPLISS